MMAVPHVVALGICDGLPELGIAWPHTVVEASTGQAVTSIQAQGGYDDQGMFVRVSYDVEPDVRNAVQERVDAWAAGTSAAPLACVLEDYANKLVHLGKGVQVLYPNGKLYTVGTFVGVDIWGRATVRLISGEDLEFPPEKFRIAQGA